MVYMMENCSLCVMIRIDDDDDDNDEWWWWVDGWWWCVCIWTNM